MRGIHAYYLPLLGVLILFNLVPNSKNELTQITQLYRAARKSRPLSQNLIHRHERERTAKRILQRSNHICNTMIQYSGRHEKRQARKASTQLNIPNTCLLVIKEWSSSGPYSHLAGGMKYHDGNLTVPITGRYYVYLQIFRYNYGRVQVFVNNNVITQLQTPGGYGTLYAGMVYNLRAGDVIKFTSVYKNFQIFMRPIHSHFGAYLI